MRNTAIYYGTKGHTTAVLADGAAIAASGVAARFVSAVRRLSRLLLERSRWALLAIPIYALLAKGVSGWPLALGLAMAVVCYNLMCGVAERRWPEWTASRALYLRCIEIGFICIGFSLLYLHSGELESYLYYDGFYSLSVALASIRFGRTGIFWSASVATLAVAVGQAIAAPEVPVILTTAGIEYWIAVALYAATFGIFFLAIGLLAHLATDLQSQRQAAPSSAAVARELSDGDAGGRMMEIAAHRERLATVGEVTAQVIHELSGPLTGIMTAVDHLQDVLDERERDSLRLIESEAERAASMVRELLDFTRRGTAEPVVSLNDVVERAIELCQLRYRSAPVEIVKEFSPEPPCIVGGPNRLQQVVLNLLENAKHAVEQCGSGRITVRTRVSGDSVSLEVSDTGRGIPEEVRAHIFEPFFTTKERGVGTGLGLAIVARIVRDCGGAIEVRSNRGGGTTFLLSFHKAA